MGLVNKWANYGKWRHGEKRKELLENKIMNTLDTVYQNLLETLINHGVEKDTRNGKTRSVFGYQIRHDMQEGFPLLTTKKMYWKGIVTELLWFLRGDTNIKYLVDNDCHIWDGDAYKNYRSKSKDIDLPENLYRNLIDDLNKNAMFPIDNPSRILSQEQFINKIKTDDEFANQWGDLGPIYGKQWRSWNRPDVQLGKQALLGQVDQIANLINDLKTNPDSRRLMVSAWNVGELDQMTLPPCHFSFQVYTRELGDEERIEWMGGKIQEKYPALVEQQIKHCDEYNVPKRAISLMWNQRSVDVPLGLPFNIASYGLLLEIIAKEVNMVPDELIGNLGDCHIYLNQVDGVKEQIGREPYPLPKLVINDEFWNPNAGLIEQINYIEITDFEIRDYQSHPTIKIPLSN